MNDKPVVPLKWSPPSERTEISPVQDRFLLHVTPRLLLNHKDFETCRARELRRSERAHSGLVLILIGASADEISGLQMLVRTLSGCMRATDCLGWYDAGTVGVLFTEINISNREAVAQLLRSRIVARIPDRFPVSICPEVFSATVSSKEIELPVLLGVGA